MSASGPPWVPLSVVERFAPLAQALGVSEVARGQGGFLPAYRRAGGQPARMSEDWQAKRAAFLKRHGAQLVGEPRTIAGLPTRRVLSMIMWAGMPAGWSVSRLRGIARRV